MSSSISNTIDTINSENKTMNKSDSSDLVLLPRKHRISESLKKKKNVTVPNRKKMEKENKVKIKLETKSYIDSKREEKIKTKLCRSIFTGKTCYENCNFAHSVEEVRKKKCRYPNCYNKQKCIFWHKEDNLEKWCERNGYSGIKNVKTKVVKRIRIEKPTSNENTKLCNTVKNGDESCRKDCMYAHSVDQLVLVQCAFGDKCNKVSTCKFKHKSETRENYLKKMGWEKYKGVVVLNNLVKCNIMVRVRPTKSLSVNAKPWKPKPKIETEEAARPLSANPRPWKQKPKIEKVSMKDIFETEEAARVLTSLSK